jgi:hypothetical protein
LRIRTILTAAAVPAALAATLLGTTAASAATTPNPNSVIKVTSQSQLDTLVAQGGGTINKNIDFPASTQGQNIWLSWTTVNGNVTDEGNVTLSSDSIHGNVTVSGPGSFLAFNNYASHIYGNLTVNGSSGTYTGASTNLSLGDWTQYQGMDTTAAQSQIDGGLLFTNSSAIGEYSSGLPLHVLGKFVYSGNVAPYAGGLIVDGQQFVS